MKMKLRLTFVVAVLFFIGHASHAAVPVEDLSAVDAAGLWDVSNGTVESAGQGNEKVFRWRINAGQTSILDLKKDLPLLSRLRYFSRCQFEFRIVSGEINGLDLNIKGHVSGPRAYKIHNWNLAVLTTEKVAWQSRSVDLSRPNWFPWDNPDGEDTDTFFRFESLALTPNTVIELRGLKLFNPPLMLKPDYELPVTWPVKTENADGDITYTSTYQVLNSGGRPATIEAKILSPNKRFKVLVTPDKREVKNGARAEFVVTAVMSKDDIAATPELYNEPLRLDFVATHEPQASCYWEGKLVRPLSPGYKRQVVVPDADIEFLRGRLAAGDAAAKGTTVSERVLARADEFLKVRLDSIPGSHAHPANSLPLVPGTNRAWKPGSFMPEIVDPETGKREAGTALAFQFWKEYLGYGGATENLGEAYLLTGDEKYAAKAVELFELYGKQYRDLYWSFPFNPVWNGGPATLSSSRTAASSTYGSNWLFKWHCKLLSMIAGSQAWQQADRKLIYEGFVLPYATEIIKFPGGISNMTDITNCNLLLLGIVFDDAHLVRHALMSDPGIIRRLEDITSDGFSSEGRPINYHYAAMDEYLPALGYLELSGLKVDYPKDRLLAALRMPYLRATLWGSVPITGDMGRGAYVRGTRLADYLVSLFPDQPWLLEVGWGATMSAKAASLRTGRKPDPEAWRKQVQAAPQLFADAGLAILRSGDKPEDQVMVTLDYGRNVFHAAMDRNQITLSAFGKTFTQGTGSLYNAGSGITINPDAKLKSFITHGSLGQNVVMVDGKDQLPAVGELVAWSSKTDNQYAVSKVTGIAPGVTHIRAVVLNKGIVVLLDRLESAEEHTYDWIYHNFGELKLGEGWSQTPSVPLGSVANFDNVVEPMKLAGSGPLQLQWDMTAQTTEKATPEKPLPAIKLVMRQLPVSGGEIFTGYTGMNNTNTAMLADKTASVIHRIKGKTLDLVTVLEPCRGESRVKSVTAGKNGEVTVLLTDGQKVIAQLDALLKAKTN